MARHPAPGRVDKPSNASEQAERTTVKRSTRKKTAAKKATRKKASVRKAGAKVVKKKAPAATKKAAARKKPAAKKKAVKKAAVKRAVKKPAVKKAAARKTAKRKPAASKPASRKTTAMLGEVEALAALMESHGLLDVTYEMDADGSKRLHVSRNGVVGQPAVHAAPAPAPVAAAPAAAEPVAAAAPAPAADAADSDLIPFKSPMVGTFYRAASPETPPFVSVGDQVGTDSVTCIIEAMKVMNEIQPDVVGEVASFEVENGQAVEFGQTLMLIRPR